MENACACESGGIARPRGVILGARTNTSTCTGIATPGGAILGAEVGGGANALCCATCGVAVTVVAPHVGHTHHFCATCGVGVGVVAPCGCRGGCLCVACGVAATVVVPRVGCCRCLCATCGVTVRVVAPCGCRHCCRRLCAAWLSWSRSSRHVVLRSWWLSSCRVVPQLWSSSSHCHWTTKEEVSRKKKKENLQAGRHSACSRKGHGNAMPSRLVVGPGRPSRERVTTCCVPSLTLWPQLELFSYLFSLFWSLPKLWDAVRNYGTRLLNTKVLKTALMT